jgi:pyridoxal phosphate enzyme (YggS family)
VRAPGGTGATGIEATWSPSEIRDRLGVLERRIERAGGDPATVKVVAVAKTFPPAAIRAALAAGLVDFGENYADELRAKAAELADEPSIRWRFIGAIQRNKLARLAPYVACYESVTRIEEGRDIARRVPGASVFVEVDTTGLAGRHGVAPADAPGLVEALRGQSLSVDGLMTVAPPGGGAAAENCFQLVGALARDLGLAECSMGMSEDLEIAVAAGATEIRVGTSLFGPRAPKR